MGDSGELSGAVTAVKRCGEYAAVNGTYDFTAQITGEMIFGSVGVVVNDASLALHAVRRRRCRLTSG